jgi:hypothetical protein
MLTIIAIGMLCVVLNPICMYFIFLGISAYIEKKRIG